MRRITLSRQAYVQVWMHVHVVDNEPRSIMSVSQRVNSI